VTIDDNLITYVEELSRLRLSEEEKAETKEKLGDILRYIDKLAELDTAQVEAVSHPFSFTNVFRDDEVAQSFDREAILRNAPRQKDGCFQVPRTVE
jgi:aspartyl-tRNA(Asn)/glutamyl-tRNA(Gln) amidotransferase subunit C